MILMPLWIKVSIWAMTAGTLAFSAWYATHQSEKRPAITGSDLLIENGRVVKVIVAVLTLAVLVGDGFMVYVVFGYTEENYARVLALSAWFALLVAMSVGMLHFVRSQLLVTLAGLYVRRAIGERFVPYQEIDSIHYIEGEPWFEINLKSGILPIRVSKEMRGWRHAEQRIQHCAEQVGVSIKRTADRESIKLLRLVTGLFR